VTIVGGQKHKRKPSDYQKQIRFLTVLSIVIVILATVLICLFFNRKGLFAGL
jgi:hypothetical protein